MNQFEIGKKELEIKFDFIPFFDNTREMSEYKGIVDQDRAAQAINLGLKITDTGYNIYVSGEHGTGRKNYILKKIYEYSNGSKEIRDWCYVYNFNDSYKPTALWLRKGEAENFKKDIDDFIDNLYEEVPRVFYSEKYEKDRNGIMEKYQKEILKLADKLYQQAGESGFNVKSTTDGFVFIPVLDNKEMSERQYNELSSEQKDRMNDNVGILKLLALEILRKTKTLKKDMSEELGDLDEEAASLILSQAVEALKSKYDYNDKIVRYFEELQQDISDNMDAFMEHDTQEDGYDEAFYKRYTVNIMVCNKKNDSIPVIYEELPEFHNLLGVIEYENKQGSMVTDFTMIKPGSLHKANGGYLIIDARELLSSYYGWEAIKRCLKSSHIAIENLKNQFDIIPIIGLKPEEIPLDIKVIMLGNEYIYSLLYNFDDDFKELFKIKAVFSSELKNIDSNVMKILGLISGYCSENKLLPVTRQGVVELLKYSLRLSESRKYFAGSFSRLTDIIKQANAAALESQALYIDGGHICSAIRLMEKRHDLYKEKILEMYVNNKYIVDFKGMKSGEINGLSVIDTGDYVFGKQNRITAATYSGKNGIVNIERESKMSGNIHSKGILILSGYLGENLGQDEPVAFNASICFEQLYGEIDGDSASAAELLALMSSLSDIPLRQSIAVTGSINQKGEIQPVGGINQKIEGFFDICSIYGLDGTHGVIIPFSNEDDLVLRDEVIEAVDKKLFHIYEVKKIDDCFEILCERKPEYGSRAIIEIVKENIYAKIKRFNKPSEGKKKK